MTAAAWTRRLRISLPALTALTNTTITVAPAAEPPADRADTSFSQRMNQLPATDAAPVAGGPRLSLQAPPPITTTQGIPSQWVGWAGTDSAAIERHRSITQLSFQRTREVFEADLRRIGLDSEIEDFSPARCLPRPHPQDLAKASSSGKPASTTPVQQQQHHPQRTCIATATRALLP